MSFLAFNRRALEFRISEQHALARIVEGVMGNARGAAKGTIQQPTTNNQQYNKSYDWG
mgnify:CR=1 FL=1